MLRITGSLFIILNLLPFYSEAQSSRQIRILTFNILHGATTRNDFDLDTIAHLILQTKPDLVALQEVDNKTNRAKGYDLVKELSDRTGMMGRYAAAMPYDGGEYGEGVLSGWDIVQSRNVALPHSPENEPRAALEIMVKTPWGDTLSFIGTHLDHLRDKKDRISQIKKINEVFAGNTIPTILAGDLNDIPGSQPINILEEKWQPSYHKSDIVPTFSSSNPRKKIDYIMFLPNHQWHIVQRQVICDQVASDHCAYFVIAELRD
ncbi:MAG: endonuclease/exonuclease/phosphatase family protein [Saprospiraceae bacterium]|nr:endonuclease/exonuclease/phosphatase family protein [Saprospiraceae bacterium]